MKTRSVLAWGGVFWLLALIWIEFLATPGLDARPVGHDEMQMICGGSFSMSTTYSVACSVPIACSGFSGWPLGSCTALSTCSCPAIQNYFYQIGNQVQKTVSTPCPVGTQSLAGICITGYVYCYPATPLTSLNCGPWGQRTVTGVEGYGLLRSSRPIVATL